MKLLNLFIPLFCLLLFSCQNSTESTDNKAQMATKPEFQNPAHKMVYNLTQKVGNSQKLMGKKDVVYTYTYTTPDGKTDMTTEKYIFAGEMSYGLYKKHERTFPELKGEIEQGFDGKNFWLKVDGKYLEDEKKMKRVMFSRKTNYYWFTMFQKLLDPGLKYEALEPTNIDGTDYDVVKITFDTEAGKKSDIYQIYINKKTSLVDRFLFTVVDFNVVDVPFVMKMEYEDVDGILIPTKRKYTQGSWEGKNINENWIMVNWTDIKFNNGLSKDLFIKKM